MKNIREKFTEENFSYFGEKSFLLGTFFLASALPISLLFFLVSMCISIFINRNVLINNKFNQIFLICAGLMIFSNLYTTKQNFAQGMQENSLAWLDLVNWIPLFILFFCAQHYLKRNSQRVLFSKVLISGSIPVLLSCGLQYWFNVYGPFEVLNGYIVWFQKELPASDYGIGGLFSNPNYAGLWLSSIFPHVVSEKLTNKNKKNSLIILIILLLFIYFSFLTSSRNAFIGILISLVFFLRKWLNSVNLLIITSSIASLFLYFSNKSFIEFTNLKTFLPINMFYKIFSLDLARFSRFDIYEVGTKLIIDKPFFGYGPSRFSTFYEINGGKWEAIHLHNMPLEVAFNYGIPLALILTSVVIFLLVKSWIKINQLYKDQNLQISNKSWLISSVIVTFNHLNDVTYYDGKISILIWIFLAGIKCIIEDDFKENQYSY